MKTNYTDKQLQSAIDEAFAKGYKAETHRFFLSPSSFYWDQEAPNRLDLIKSALAALPEPMDEESMLLNLLAVIHRDGGHYQAEHGTRKAVEDACKEWQRLISIAEKTVLTEPPTVDGKTPEDVMQSVYYSTPADEYPFRKAASAVLAAFGKQSQAAEEANARAEKAEAELARIIEAAHEAGWNGVENPKDLAQFIKYLAEEVGNRQAALLAACTSVDEQEVLSLSQLRPISEAGPVPEGCVRYYAASADYAPSLNQWSEDTHFADIRLPESAEKPETFEAHGKTWTKHKPGDAMPCARESIIQCLFADGNVWYADAPAQQFRWSKLDSIADIIGWRYADKPTPEPLVTKPISLPEWTPQVGDVVTLKSGGPNMTVVKLADTESDLSAFLCEWFSAAGEYDAGVIYLTSLQPA